MKNSIICLLLLLFFALIFTGIKAYGLYEDHLTGNVTAPAAGYIFKINDATINSANSTFVINGLVASGNTHSNNQTLAPSSSAYFDIILEPVSIDVAIRYDITIDFSNLHNDKITFDNIMNFTKSSLLTRTGEFTYTGVIPLVDVTSNTSNTIRTALIWTNDETNNETDSKMMDLGTISVPVSILITQYTGETITEYTG